MARSTNRCEYAHTPQSPHKMRVRGEWLRACDPSKDIVAISHALCDSLVTLGWQGKVAWCDIDSGVREQIGYGIKGRRQTNQKDTPPDYPTLQLLEPGGDVKDTVENYCDCFGTKDLAAVDVDLTACVKGCWPVLSGVLDTLLERKAHGALVLLTFRNGRKCSLGSTEKRITWLKRQLPNGVEHVKHEAYNSTRIGENVERSKGSPMCIVWLKVV